MSRAAGVFYSILLVVEMMASHTYIYICSYSHTSDQMSNSKGNSHIFPIAFDIAGQVIVIKFKKYLLLLYNSYGISSKSFLKSNRAFLVCDMKNLGFFRANIIQENLNKLETSAIG